MQYLLFDLAKQPLKYKKLPFIHAQICLFVKNKQAKRLITPAEPHRIYVLPKENTAYSMIQAAEEILQLHSDRVLTIVSPRGKVQAALSSLQQRYPNAQIQVFRKYGKKAKKYIKMNAVESILNVQANDEKTAGQNQAAPLLNSVQQNEAEENGISEAIHRSHNNETVFTLLEQQNQETDKEIQAALLLLKKNRPKKKNDLVHLLTHTRNGTPEQALELVIMLEQTGHIQIDAAENVRYQKCN